MALTIHKGNQPHVAWIDLKDNGLLVECAILKQDSFGNVYYIETGKLDNIDKRRLVRILNNRNAASMPLWDLMSQTTLNNGVNALTYFHQLVKLISQEHIIINPRQGVVGSRTGQVDMKNAEQIAAMNMAGDKIGKSETATTTTKTTKSKSEPISDTKDILDTPKSTK